MSSSKAVNVPVNEKQKERDVNTKLQLYGIFQGTHSPVCTGTLIMTRS
jgi:hypothetical protein